MASILGSLHFWTAKDNQFSVDSNIGIYNYHGKANQQQQMAAYSNNYTEEFKAFCEERGVQWNVNNKRPEKLRENLNLMEDLLSVHKCVYCEWRSRNVLLMMLSNGAIVKVWMKAGLGDVSKIRTDKFLVGKLASEHVVDVLFLECAIVVSYVEAKLTLIQLNKKLSSKENSNIQFEKLSSLDPKLLTVDLSGPNRRRFERRLSASIQNDQLMVWWMTKKEEMPGPWAPPSTDREKANIHVYNINKNELQLVCYTRTQCDPIWASFSRLHLHHIHTVEQSVKDGQVAVHLCVYDMMKTKLQRTDVTTIPLSSVVVCHGMNPTEDRSLLGCKDGSLVMYDAHKNSTQITKGGFVASVIGWHPSGALVMVGSDKGHLQCYDIALSVLNIALLTDNINPLKLIDLSTYFKNSPTLQKVMWNPLEYSPLDWCGYVDNTHTLFVQMHRGPIGVLSVEAGAQNRGALTAMELITQYIKFSQFHEAIDVLLCINWNIESELCFKAVTLIVVSLLKLPLTDTTELELERALGTYYSAPYELSHVVTLEYHHKMTCLARRFFHHLLRHDRFEKAFLLAVDIGARDLFMDIHYIAKDKNERVLSQAALERANQLETGSDSSSLDDDSVSYSSSTCSSSSNSSGSSINNNSDTRAAMDDNHRLQSKRWEMNDVTYGFQQQLQQPSSSSSQWAIERRSSQQPNSNAQPSISTYTRASMNAPQVMSDISEEISEEEDIHGTVHVVHFGIV